MIRLILLMVLQALAMKSSFYIADPALAFIVFMSLCLGMGWNTFAIINWIVERHLRYHPH